MAGPLPDNHRPWRWASASRTGTSHLRRGIRKQDACTTQRLAPTGGRDGILSIVSDGAGSASHGGQGASLVCRILSLRVRQWCLKEAGLPADDEVTAWIDEVRDRVGAVAAKNGLQPRDFAATLVLLLVVEDQILTLQVGDSAMAGRCLGTWESICWPVSGEYASTTYFVTDDPEPRLTIARQPLRHDAFALFSDGIEHLALDHLTMSPYSRFFDPMIKPIEDASGLGRLRDLSAALARYLDGPRVCDRTDDDKTLVLISRT